MRLIKLVFSGFGLFVGASSISAFAGCSIETPASDVICVANQSNVCTDCPKTDPSDTRTYHGRHTCAADGKSFGACEQCKPVTSDGANDFTAVPEHDAGPPPPGPTIGAACAKKLGLLAGRDDPFEQFTYAAVYDGVGFKAFSVSGAPMRSPAAVATSGSSVLAVYRSKGDALVTTTLAGGLWSPPTGVAGARTDVAPALVTWGSQVKAIFHDTDGHYRVANYDPSSDWATTLDLVGSASATPPSGGSSPSAAISGGPGVPGSLVLFGYTDDAGGLYREEWRGSSWLPNGIKASTVRSAPVRPAIVAMASGAFDLVSAYVNEDGTLHAATRTPSDRGSIWSADTVVSDAALPLDGANGVGLPGGRALLVYRDADKKGWFTVFDPSKTPAWTPPAALVAGSTNPALASTPQLVKDTCGADVTLAYATEAGDVALLRYVDGAWKGPFAVAGLSHVTYATVVAAP